MRKIRGTRQAQDLQAAILELIGDFDEELTNKGLSRRLVDAHVAAILIDILQLIVVERETFSSDDLTIVFEETLREIQHEH